MASISISRRLIPPLVLLSLPVVCVFLVLASFGYLKPLPALLGAVATVALIALLLGPLVRDITRTLTYIRELARGGDAVAPVAQTPLVGEVISGLTHLRRAWVTRAEELAKQIAFQDTLFESLPDPLFLISHQRRITRANPAARVIFGRSLESRDLAGVLRNPPLLEAVEQVLHGARGVDVEFTISSPVEREFRALVEPLPRAGGEPPGALVTLHDITALKRMEQMRADFIANASHELRTPLSALLGFIETLRGPARDDTEARERFLGIMQEQASRMSRLVADLLNLSRIELNEHTPPQGKAEIPAILGRVAEGLMLQARQRRMSIELDIADDLPAVEGQEDELAQIFQNLMDNALKYGKEGTPIEVGAHVTSQLPAGLAVRASRAVMVSVRDHGEGIAREHLPRLTERFFRVDTARSRRMGGTGLGLAIVKHLVNRHRGLLTVDSTLGAGTVFSVYLPLPVEE